MLAKTKLCMAKVHGKLGKAPTRAVADSKIQVPVPCYAPTRFLLGFYAFLAMLLLISCSPPTHFLLSSYACTAMLLRIRRFYAPT
eukprot:2407881-Rhodomonas_salina.2